MMGLLIQVKKFVKFISKNSDNVVKDLLKFGVEFDTDKNGKFTLTKEAAHSVRRILHSGGDATGRQIEIALCKAIKDNKNIEIYENTIAIDLLVNENICNGVIAFHHKTKEYETIYSDAIIIATGGIGQLYKYTTNPTGATGDGIALCYCAGADLQDVEFVQFHPTALAFDDKQNHNRFLISEAVRGEGAKLRDKSGQYYMKNYSTMEELAPRDIVARANFQQMQKDNESCVFLDVTVIGKDKLLQRFPTISRKCASFRIDITKDFIPVAPAAHYFMGGVKTNLNSETSIKNLYAIGEVSCTGLHGANRLASNSLLECVVCAYNVAKNIVFSDLQNKNHKDYSDFVSKYDKKSGLNSTKNIEKYHKELQNVMWENVGIFRNEQNLQKALSYITELESLFDENNVYCSKEEYELRNMIITAKLITLCAISRKESRGAHYRTDYLQTDNNARHSLINKAKSEVHFVK